MNNNDWDLLEIKWREKAQKREKISNFFRGLGTFSGWLLGILINFGIFVFLVWIALKIVG